MYFLLVRRGGADEVVPASFLGQNPSLLSLIVPIDWAGVRAGGVTIFMFPAIWSAGVGAFTDGGVILAPTSWTSWSSITPVISTTMIGSFTNRALFERDVLLELLAPSQECAQIGPSIFIIKFFGLFSGSKGQFEDFWGVFWRWPMK